MGGHPSPVIAEPRVAKGRSREVTYTEISIDPRVIADRGRRAWHARSPARSSTTAAGSPRLGEGAHSVLLHPHQDPKLVRPTTDPEVVAARPVVVLARFPLDRPIVCSACGWCSKRPTTATHRRAPSNRPPLT